ncbi:MAG TPA: hypothetical protein PL180_18480 [Spirochaetota bacterium]|nr:hypothetical protein [Spirochaetota bacterium]HPL18674.1 hypothetical protein [Spirochaetota bacterium]HRS78903.1 hypothetical protein [Spirochaetota bacterium]HRT74801.1 hypothetical protein [Spirochaetota bacterium]
MKKAVIAVAILSLFALVYFVCGDSEITDGSKNPLMTSTAGSRDGTSSPDDEEQASGSDEEKEGQEEVKKAAENTVTFTVRGESGATTFKSVNPFIKIARTSDMTGYVANFASDMSGIRVADQSTYTRVLSMLIPADVTPGTYNEKSSNFMFQYFGTESGVMYSLDVNYPFTLTIEEWGGPGGRARGSFSGELKVEGSNSVILIQDGRFDAGIQ